VKTGAIAARMRIQGEVTAVERDPARARQIAALSERAGATNVRVVVADAAAGEAGRDYDRVLVDPPCSDLGTLASRPDARWRKDPAMIRRLAAEQQGILRAGLEALRPGGTLVYSTCTISDAENRSVLAAAGAGLEWEEFATRPDRDRTDGFFIARVREAGGA
jgi:16S rRNA (cytosine967-C5)-methyltransferase